MRNSCIICQSFSFRSLSFSLSCFFLSLFYLSFFSYHTLYQAPVACPQTRDAGGRGGEGRGVFDHQENQYLQCDRIFFLHHFCNSLPPPPPPHPPSNQDQMIGQRLQLINETPYHSNHPTPQLCVSLCPWTVLLQFTLLIKSHDSEKKNGCHNSRAGNFRQDAEEGINNTYNCLLKLDGGV